MKKYYLIIVVTLAVLSCFIILTSAAPAPPTGVHAEDVPDDNGGFMNINWTKSDDDSEGGNNVTNYTIYRAEAGSGPFTKIGSTLKGNVSYIDSTEDGTPYWYKVSSSPGNESSNDTTPGSAQSSDNLPPTINSTDPEKNENVSVTSDVSVVFSEKMNKSTVENEENFYINDSSVRIDGTISYNDQTKTATFNPTSNFNYTIQYTVTVTTEVEDLAGNTMVSNNIWNFTTSGNQGPELLDPKVDPIEGTTPATFHFSVTYEDNENNPAEYVHVIIDGLDNNPYIMTTSDPDDKDKKEYKCNVTISGIGSYNYSFEASDGLGSSPTKTESNTITVHSKTHYTGNRIWEAGMAEDEYFWTPRTFSGFYYNLDTDEGGEKLTIKNIGLSIDKDDIIYETEPIMVQFERSAFGHYNVIGFMADRYFAGYENGTIGDASHSLLDEEILSRVLIDDDESQMVESGSPLVLKEGYDFRVTEYGASEDDVMVGLFKDGENVDETILSEGQTYTYEKDMGSADKIPIIAVRVETVFRGIETSKIKIDGIFQISEDYIEVERGEEFGEMEVDAVSEMGIKMTNSDSVSLKKGNTFNLMGKINIEVGDSGTLRFAPTVDISEPGTYELRGTVTEEADYSWTPLNFEGLLYDMDSGDGNENLSVKRDNIDDRKIDNGKLTYSTGTIGMSFEYSGWGTYDTIGFMGDKYFAGYRDDTIMNDGISLMETGHLGKILIDEDEKHTLYVGNSLPLLEGYSMRVDEISRDGDSIMVALLKDGEEIDSEITNEGKTYTYTKEIDKEDIPIVAIRFEKIFRGQESNSIFIKGVFQISGDFKLVEQGDTYGEMEVKTVLDNKITMKNDDDISLSKDSDVSIMGDIKIKVADSSTVRFYPYQTIKVEPLQSLEIDIPANIYENEEFTIRVTSDNDEVEGASITFDDIEIGSTDSNGELTYTPAETGTFTVTASKSGYKSDSIETEVVYQPETLDIKFPLVVDKGESFMISITSEGSPLSGVLVMFGNQDLGTTPASGNITHISDEIGTFTITASKSGYQEISKDINIADPSARLVFSNLIIEPKEVEPRQMVNITVEAANFGTLQEAETVILTINEEEERTREVTLGSGETTTLKFNVNRSKPGTYDVGIGERNGTFEVIGGGGIGVIGIAVLGIIGILSAGAVVYSIAQGTLTFETITAKFQALEQTIRRLIEK